MKISNNLSTEVILSEIGGRIKRVRLRRNVSQKTLADDAGVGVATLIRLEAGKTVQIDTLIRVLRELSFLDNLELLVPPDNISPMEALAMEKRKISTRRMRASTTQNVEPVPLKGGFFVKRVRGEQKPKDIKFVWGKNKK